MHKHHLCSFHQSVAKYRQTSAHSFTATTLLPCSRLNQGNVALPVNDDVSYCCAIFTSARCRKDFKFEESHFLALAIITLHTSFTANAILFTLSANDDNPPTKSARKNLSLVANTLTYLLIIRIHNILIPRGTSSRDSANNVKKGPSILVKARYLLSCS